MEAHGHGIHYEPVWIDPRGLVRLVQLGCYGFQIGHGERLLLQLIWAGNVSIKNTQT